MKTGKTETDDFDFMAPPAKRRGRKPRSEGEKFVPVSFKLPPEAHAILVDKANRHSGGNLSQWLRRAGTEYEPAGTAPAEE